MRKNILFVFVVITVIFNLAVFEIKAQSSNSTASEIVSCVDLSAIFTQSYNGYRNFRYNERLSKGNYYIYETTMPKVGLQRAFVQSTKVPLFAGGIITAAHYHAFSIFKTLDEATAQVNLLKASMKVCQADALNVTRKPEGYLEQTKYFIPVKIINSEITVVLSMLKAAESDYYVSLQVVSNLSTTEPGIMKDPPTTPK